MKLVRSAWTLLLLAGIMTPAQAQTANGTIKYPCGHPDGRRISIAGDDIVTGLGNQFIQTLGQGECGWLIPSIDSASLNKRFKLHPTSSADLDIYFYNSHGDLVGDYASNIAADASRACGDVFDDPSGVPYRVPAGSASAIVVLSANPKCTQQQNVGFTYETYLN